MPDLMTRLRDADPASDVDTPPPAHVLQAILATPPRDQRPRRAPRIVLAAATLAAAAVVALAALPATETGPTLAERAFAATAPMPDFITYTQTTTVQDGSPSMDSTDRLRQWQYRDRMHNFMDVIQPRGSWRYEHDQNGGTFRTLINGKELQVTRKTDPGWSGDELEEGFRAGVTTLVETFREQIRTAQDLGETTFDGKPAHAYRGAPGEGRRPPGEVTYYVDPKTALPLGSTAVFTVYAPKVVDGKVELGEPDGEITIVTTVDRYERLEPTRANLAKLDAPNIDAAAK